MTNMNYERQYQKTASDSCGDHYEYLRNFPAESRSTYFVRFNRFLQSPPCTDKCFYCHLFYEYGFISVFLSFSFFFFNLKTVTFIPFWHPVKTDRSYSTLSRAAEFGKSVKQHSDLIRHDCFFRLPLHSS